MLLRYDLQLPNIYLLRLLFVRLGDFDLQHPCLQITIPPDGQICLALK
jgi:hypothetical protein